MYFPILRGKQYELLAVREMASFLDTQVCNPVIEPVTENLAGVFRLAQAATTNGLEIGIVLNPTVGEVSGPTADRLIELVANAVDNDNSVFPVFHANDTLAPLITESQNVSKVLSSSDRCAIIYADGRPLDDVLKHRLADFNVFVDQFIDAELPPRRIRQFNSENSRPISVRDPIVPAERNADYLDRDVETFSEDAYFFDQDGYQGFADYATIGAGWKPGGFRPRAVAIHWTYPDEVDPDNPRIAIRHFTSTTNDTFADVAGKFGEAGRKFAQWYASSLAARSVAGDRLLQYVQDESFPGLGVLKKLSVQNHLEITQRVLQNKRTR